MAAWSIVRYIVLGLSLIFTFVVLGLSAHLLEHDIFRPDAPPVVETLGLAVSGISLAGLITMLVIGLLRRKAFVSMIVTEICVLSFLWILWIAIAAFSTDVLNFNFPLGCSAYLLLGTMSAFYVGLCTELTAIQGMSFVNWLLLMCYSVTLLITAMVAQSRGNRVWTISVDQVNFFPQTNVNQEKVTQALPAINNALPQFHYPPPHSMSVPNNAIATVSAGPTPSHPMV